MSRRSEWGFLLLCLSLAGCGSAPEQRSPMSAAAYRHSERGARAYAQGDLARAAKEYQQAVQGAQAIEDAAGIATASINLARVWRGAGRYPLAHQQLAALFDAPQLVYPADLLAVAAILQGQLYLEQDEIAAATDWAARAEPLCASGCEVRPSLRLLQAQLAMRAQRWDAAAKLIADALGSLNAPAQAMERANALRLAGEVAYAQQDDARASARFAEALALDQRLGLPNKISLDLNRLAQSAKRAGRAAEAANYEARAAAVVRAGTAAVP